MQHHVGKVNKSETLGNRLLAIDARIGSLCILNAESGIDQLLLQFTIFYFLLHYQI